MLESIFDASDAEFERRVPRIRQQLERDAAWAWGVAISHELALLRSAGGWPHLNSPAVPLERLAERIRRILERPRVVVVLREQASFLESWYAQLMKTGLVNPKQNNGQLWRWWRAVSDGSHGSSAAQLLLYTRLCDRLASCFGAENLRILPFERVRHDMPAFARSIAEELGADPASAVELIEASHHKQRAEAMPRRGARLWRNPLGRQLRRAMPRAAREAIGRRLSAQSPELNPALKQEIRSFYREDNARLASWLEEDLSQWGY